MFILTTPIADQCLTWMNDTSIQMGNCNINATQLWFQRDNGAFESVYRPGRCLQMPKSVGGLVVLASCTNSSEDQGFNPRLLTVTQGADRCVGPCNELDPNNSTVCLQSPSTADWCVVRAHTSENRALWVVRYMDLVLSKGIWLNIGESTCSAEQCGWGIVEITYICRNINGDPPLGYVNSFCDLNNKPASELGGAPCVDQACAPINGNWADWSICSASCGPGIQQRSCSFPETQFGGIPCPGNDTQVCEVAGCAVNGNYSAWSTCSTTCGPGVQTRQCNSPPPLNGGKNCTELNLGPASRACVPANPTACPIINGGFSEWSQCSATCSVGTQIRACNNPTPSGGGRNCTGEVIRTCDTGVVCPVSETSAIVVSTAPESTLSLEDPFSATNLPDSIGLPSEVGTILLREENTSPAQLGLITNTASASSTMIQLSTGFNFATYRIRRQVPSLYPRVIPFPNGTIVLIDGTVTFTNGIKRFPNNTIAVPGNSTASYPISKGTVSFTNGSVQMSASGRVTVSIPDPTIGKDNITTITFPPHAVMIPNGVILFPNGTVFNPTNVTNSTSANLNQTSTLNATLNNTLPIIPKPSTPTPPGSNPIRHSPWVFPDGAIYFPNGTLQLPADGGVLYPNGTISKNNSSKGPQPWVTGIIVSVLLIVFITIIVAFYVLYRRQSTSTLKEQLIASAFMEPFTDTPQLRTKAPKAQHKDPLFLALEESVTVTFQLQCSDIAAEEYVVVIGSSEALGQWSVSEAPCMLAAGNGIYRLAVRLPRNTPALYQFAKVRPGDFRTVFMGKERIFLDVGSDDMETPLVCW